MARGPPRCYRRSSVCSRARKRISHMQAETPNEVGGEARAPASELARPVAEALAAGLTHDEDVLVLDREPALT